MLFFTLAQCNVARMRPISILFPLMLWRENPSEGASSVGKICPINGTLKNFAMDSIYWERFWGRVNDYYCRWLLSIAGLADIELIEYEIKWNKAKLRSNTVKLWISKYSSRLVSSISNNEINCLIDFSITLYFETILFSFLIYDWIKIFVLYEIVLHCFSFFFFFLFFS